MNPSLLHRAQTLWHWAGDLSVGFFTTLRLPVRPLGNRFQRLPDEKSLHYFDWTLRTYERYAGRKLCGRICEVGPGNSLGMGFAFVAAGADQVDLVDRFPIADAAGQEPVGRILSEHYAKGLVRRGLAGADVRARIAVHGGVTAEEYFSRCEASRYDFIFSSAVMEHLSDPIGALSKMEAALKPGGAMVHVVDLRGHALFRNRGPLAWLKTPQAWHDRLIRHTARPNRVLAHQYRAWAAARPGAEIFVRSVVGTDKIFGRDAPPPDAWQRAREIVERERGGFSAELRAVHTDDLAVTVLALVVRRPAEIAHASASANSTAASAR